MGLDAAEDPLYQRRSDLRFRRVDDTAVAILQREARVLVLNEVGVRVLELVDGATPVSGLVTALVREYQVEEDEARRDVLHYLEELKQAGLVLLGPQEAKP